MGYDMYMRDDLTQAEVEAKAAAQKAFDEAVAERDALPDDQSGSWFSPEEQELSDEEKKKIGTDKWAEADRLTKEEGLSFDVARRRVMSVQPSPEWEAAQERVEKAYNLLYDRPDYFRLNIWGMSEARDVMINFGMLKDDSESAWPERPSVHDDEKVSSLLVETIEEALYGHDNRRDYIQSEEFKAEIAKSLDEWNGDDHRYRVDNNLPKMPAPTDEQIMQVVEFVEACDAHLEAHDADTAGISIHKLCSNDGWLVTPEECAGAVKMWDLHPEADRKKVAEKKPYIVEFVEWIRLMADRGGFRVC